MLQIRYSTFETNSSSADILIIPKQQDIRVPKRFIVKGDDTSKLPDEKVMASMIETMYYNKERLDQLVNFLYLNGVEEIIYGGSNAYFRKAIETFKDNPQDLGVPTGWGKDSLLKALFGVETTVEHYGSGDTRPNRGPGPEYEEIDSDAENLYREFYAD